jgi:hypothetical protein
LTVDDHTEIDQARGADADADDRLDPFFRSWVI